MTLRKRRRVRLRAVVVFENGQHYAVISKRPFGAEFFGAGRTPGLALRNAVDGLRAFERAA